MEKLKFSFNFGYKVDIFHLICTNLKLKTLEIGFKIGLML
jgi:hypothetical protein